LGPRLRDSFKGHENSSAPYHCEAVKGQQKKEEKRRSPASKKKKKKTGEKFEGAGMKAGEED